MLKVVIADDEIRICKLLQMLVDWNALGFEVVAVEHDGKSLREAVDTYSPDVVITDIRMPGFTGLELLHSIHERNLDIDVIIISGYRQFEYVHQALKDGAIDYITKPLESAAIQEALKKVSARRAAVNKDRERVKNVQETSERFSRKLHEDLVFKILNGQIRESTIEELNHDYGCGFEKEKLFFAAFKIDSVDHPIDHIGQNIREYIREEMEKKGHRCFTGDRGNIVYLLINADSVDAFSQALYQMGYQLHDHYLEIGNGHVTVGLAEVENGRLYDGAYCSYCAALNQLFKGVEKVILYKKGPDFRYTPLFDNRTDEKIQKALERGDRGYMMMVARELFENIRHYGDSSQSGLIVYRLMCDLQERLIRLSMIVLNNNEDVKALIEKYTVSLHCCYSWNSYQKILNDEINDLMTLITEWKSSKEKQPVRQIKRIIDEHYREELSLEQLADEMNLSLAYVSKLFKKELGVTFTQYLNNIRLEQAKKYLRETSESIANIADTVGYQDEKYFMRVFKKETGLTAKEYRQLYGE